MLQRLRELSISGRSFLLVFAALVVAVAIALVLAVNRPPLRNAPVSIDDIADHLQDRRSVPPQFPGFGGGPRREGPGPGRAQDGGPGGRGPGPGDMRGPGGPPRDELRIETLSSPPEVRNIDAAASTRMTALLAARLDVAEDRVLLRIPRGAFLSDSRDGPGAMRGDGRSRIGQGFVAALRLDNGQWRTLISIVEAFPTRFQRQIMLLSALGLALLLPLAWLFARALSAPLRQFAEGAQRLGRDPTAPPLPTAGPREMRVAADAFNTMQARVNRLLTERTQMIAAIAHDLRTPLTRLAFRLEGLPAPLSDKVQADIQEMKEMIAATLEFIRDRATAGQRERLDLRLLVERIVDDHADLGHDVTLAAGAPLIIEGVPLALRRMIVNLVENAVKYGARARLRLTVADGHATIVIDDDGPGIPENRQQQVFDPFFRLESSRNRDTGGIGLGLATVRAIVLDHGGEIVLGNLSGAGLRVTVTLPLPA